MSLSIRIRFAGISIDASRLPSGAVFQVEQTRLSLQDDQCLVLYRPAEFRASNAGWGMTAMGEALGITVGQLGEAGFTASERRQPQRRRYLPLPFVAAWPTPIQTGGWNLVIRELLLPQAAGMRVNRL